MAKNRRNGRSGGNNNLKTVERLVEQCIPVLEQLLTRRTGPNDILALLSLRHAAKSEGFSTDAMDRLIRNEMDKLAADAPAPPH